jgi:hypothetical protein
MMIARARISQESYCTPSRSPTTLLTFVRTSSHSLSRSDNQVIPPPEPILISTRQLSSSLGEELTISLDDDGSDDYTQIRCSI